MAVAIMVLSLYFVVHPKDSNEVVDLRHPLEKPMACALQIAKQSDYSPNPRTFCTRANAPSDGETN
jgi:hypothetical protein